MYVCLQTEGLLRGVQMRTNDLRASTVLCDVQHVTSSDTLRVFADLLSHGWLCVRVSSPVQPKSPSTCFSCSPSQPHQW